MHEHASKMELGDKETVIICIQASVTCYLHVIHRYTRMVCTIRVWYKIRVWYRTGGPVLTADQFFLYRPLDLASIRFTTCIDNTLTRTYNPVHHDTFGFVNVASISSVLQLVTFYNLADLYEKVCLFWFPSLILGYLIKCQPSTITQCYLMNLILCMS